MNATRRPGEITYYEELGVGSRASPDEIREAFRAMARILHPDQHTDPHLKRIAEAQMRKLNRIHAILSDPEQRRQYDQLLDADYPPIVAVGRPLADPALKNRLRKSVWIAAILCGAGILTWFTIESTPATVSLAREGDVGDITASDPATARPDQAAEIASLRSDLRTLTMERDAAVRELRRLRGEESTSPADGAERSPGAELRLPSPVITDLNPIAPPAPTTTPPSRTDKPIGRKLAGFWFYASPAKGQHNKNQALYPPEYIELTIQDENGTIRGKYRSRFRIVDKAISPDVNFTFTGTPLVGSQGTFPWTGTAGAKGQLTLKFMSENSLRIEWNALDLGTVQGLDEGTAILTRRIE